MGLGLAQLTLLAITVAGPPPVRPACVDSAEAEQARAHLVGRIVATGVVRDQRVLAALRTVPRHCFVDAPLEMAYRDRPFPIGYGQTISQPLVVALMTQALNLHGTERVLEVGTGSGYQAAVLSLEVEHLDSIELLAPLGDLARSRLAAFGYKNVAVHVADGYLGWPPGAPFDRILLTASPPKLPDALVEQLAPDGLIVAPIGQVPTQRLFRWRKHDGQLTQEDLGPIRFVPMVHQR